MRFGSLPRPRFTVAQAKAGGVASRTIWSILMVSDRHSVGDNSSNFFSAAPDLEHRKLGFEIPRPLLRRFKRWKYRLHPAIDFQTKALGHHKVSACDVAGLRLVRHRQRLFHGNSLGCPLPI